MAPGKKHRQRKTPKLLKADMHIHTARSGDSDISVWDIMEQARVNGLDVVGVVDHNTTKGGLETKRLAEKEFQDIIVLAGQEVRTESGEIMVFRLEKDLPKDRPLIETCKKAKKMGGFIIIPHPFDPTRSGIGKRMNEILPYIDAVEVFNSKSIWKRFNMRAREFAESRGLPMVAGSDAHFPAHIGMCYTIIEAKPNEKDIFRAIKEGKTSYSGKASGLFNTKLISRTRHLIKNMRNQA